MTIYAKQIAPGYQESPLFLCDSFPENINVFGNSHYNEHCNDLFNRVWRALYDGEILDALEDLRHGVGWYSTWADALRDIIPPEGRSEYTREERKRIIPDIVNRFSNCPAAMETSIICEALEVVTGKKWNYGTIHGTCQGDWQYVVYPADDWNRTALEAFETEYFNTGSEWIIHDGDDAPECAEDISGYSVYCIGLNNDQIRAEIRDAYGAAADAEVVLYEFGGYIHTPTYNVAD